MRHQLVVSLAICSVACIDGSAPLPLGETDTGSQVGLDAGWPDARVQGSHSITVYDTSGQRAPNALVYELNGSQGRLLGRADADGVFFVNSAARVLVRRGFDQVEIRQLARDENVDIYLAPIEDRPQTQELFSVGLESMLFRGDVFRVLMHGQWLVAAETDFTPEGLTATLVHINAATGEVSRLPLPTRPIIDDNAFETYLAPVDQETAVVVVAGGPRRGPKSGTVTFLEVRTGNVISNFNFEGAISLRPTTDVEGEFALLSTTLMGQLHVDHFAVDGSQAIRRSQIDFAYPASGAAGLGLRNGVAYFEHSPNVIAAEVSSRSFRIAIEGVIDEAGCGTSCWFGPTGVHHLGLDDTGELVYGGDARSSLHSLGFFDSSALAIHPRGDVALVIGQRARPDKLAFVDPINATSVDLPISEFLDGVRLASDGPNYAVFAQTLGPAYYTWQSDGSNLQRVDVPEPGGLDCVFPNIGLSDFETKRRWLACGTGEPEDRKLFETDTGVQRNFFSSAQYTQHARGGSWMYFYDLNAPNREIGIYAIDTEALR